VGKLGLKFLKFGLELRFGFESGFELAQSEKSEKIKKRKKRMKRNKTKKSCFG